MYSGRSKTGQIERHDLTPLVVFIPQYFLVQYITFQLHQHLRVTTHASLRVPATSHVLIAHHTQVNPSLHVRICYLTCDLYCNTSARFQEIAVTIVKNYFTELLKNALVLKPVSNAKKQDTINDQ